MHYTSNERDWFSLSIHVFYFENKCGNRKWYLETLFFYFYFSNFHISTNDALDDLRFNMDVAFTSRELCLRFLFRGLVLILCKKKTGKFLSIFVNIFF